jgi:hypothetical protein
MSKITLLYFKDTGKWAYEGTLEFPDDGNMYELRDLVKSLDDQRKLPGLASGSWDGPIYIDSSLHPKGFPQLIL